MQDKGKRILKATILNGIVAIFFVIVVCVGILLLFGNKVQMAVSLINTVSTRKTETKQEPITLIENKVKNYPAYGTVYARLKISALNLDLPVYFGDSLEILKQGVGHSSGSYFPGEGASIIFMAHNSENRFRNFSKLKIGDVTTIETDYGTFDYKIYDMKIVKETDLEALPIQKEKEILMMYTCYPFNNIGYATQRYVVYASLEK